MTAPRRTAPAARAPRTVPAAYAPRVVLDTSVGLSALLFAHGTAARLRHLWQGGRFEPLASSATVAELMRVLAYPKFKLTAQVQHELLADYLPYTTTVTVPEPPPAVPPCRDAHDLPFLHLAVASRARVLVTGDADLLALAGQVRFRISTLADFLAQSER